ncbi:hypothetical protein [Rossellomorea arthrocnemi]|jgi:hypothetical protein|uniref:hypothetical protein n=1 Tax=Rossellomorea arthrocnemi TaxID=2769542 RepID=UPI00191AC5DF|nr:hypothetical protein [Rossellomorea arthrocnemi]
MKGCAVGTRVNWLFTIQHMFSGSAITKEKQNRKTKQLSLMNDEQGNNTKGMEND